jgi:hypothetical protein
MSTDLELNIHKKKNLKTSAAVQDSTCVSTQVELQKLKEQFSFLKSVVIKEEKNEKKKATPEPMSLTQTGTIDLTEEIGELQQLVKKHDSPEMPPPMSANQLAICDLKQKVKKLTEQLEAKDLYCDSLKNDMFSGALKTSRKRNSEYSELMEEIVDLHMENKELMEYINCDKKRFKQRKH